MIINVIRKPLIESVVKNIKAHECGGINIDNCRISTEDLSLPKYQTVGYYQNPKKWNCYGRYKGYDGLITWTPSDGGRFPSNLVLSKSSLPHLPQATQGHWANAKITGYGDGIGEGSIEYFGVGEKDQSGGTVARYFFIVGD